MTCRRWSPILVETRTAKPGIEVVRRRGAGRATSPTAVGGGDVALAIAVAPVGGAAVAAVEQSSAPTWAVQHHRTQHLFEIGGGVVPTGGELWATDAGTRDDVTAQWEHILSATYRPWTVAIPELPEPNAFQAWVRRWPIDGLLLVDCACEPCSGWRARPQLGDTDGEFVVVTIIQKGVQTFSQCHTEATLTPGDVTAWDSTRRSRFTIAESLLKRSMLIPRAALDEA